MSFWYYISAVALLIILLVITKKVGLSLLISYVFLMIAVTVFSRGVRESRYELMPFASYRKALTSSDYRAEIYCNVFMFIPVGILIPETLHEFKRKHGLGRCIPNGICISALIEILQLCSQRGLCETDDIISNTIGLVIGFVLFVLGSAIVHVLYGKQTGDHV